MRHFIVNHGWWHLLTSRWAVMPRLFSRLRQRRANQALTDGPRRGLSVALTRESGSPAV